MSVEHFKSDNKDFFEDMEQKEDTNIIKEDISEIKENQNSESNLVNKDKIDDIEKKLKEQKKINLEKENKIEKDDEIEEVKDKEIDPSIVSKNLEKEQKILQQDLEKDIGVIEDDSKDKKKDDNKSKKDFKKEEKIEIKPKLKFLEDPTEKDVVYIGRKKSVLKQYGKMATAYIGKVAEDQCRGKKVHLDGLNPHVVFLDGARGTGKSYLLGVIAEQLAKSNPYIGQIVIDPVGVFWSMKFPNRDKKELQILEEWGLKPEGLKNLKVFIPEGVKDQVSEETFDDTFSMFPSLLTPEDWCITFGIDRFSPGGLLLEKTISFVKKGYKAGGTKDNPEVEKIKSKGNQYTLDDIVYCLQNNSDFSSSSKGYKPDSIRALVSRFEAAKSWGIFSDHGTPLSKLSRENQLTVLDTSFLDENITALVIGILARRILAARKLLARQDAVKKFSNKEIDAEQMLEIEIPPTWMYIDEAHTLIPSGNTLTPATAGIIEYVKQGRRPGCSLVFATQQPSAINTKVLSQVDVLISNKLVFNDDIHAIQKRMPAIIPKQYKEPNFIKTIPFATALCGERSEETSRAFILRAAPRASQHEGRDAETIREVPKKTEHEVLEISTNMIFNKLEKSKEIKISFAKDIVDVVNVKYKSNVLWDDVLEKLKQKGVFVDSEYLSLNKEITDAEHENIKKQIRILEGDESGNSQEEVLENSDQDLEDKDSEYSDLENEITETEETTKISRSRSQNVIVPRISRYKVEDIAKSKLKKNIFFKPKEVILNIVLKHRAIYKINYNLYDENNNFKREHCYIDSKTGEFIHFVNSKLKESEGLKVLEKLDYEDLDILHILQKQQTLFSLAQTLNSTEKEVAEKYISRFKDLDILNVSESNNRELYKLSKNFDVPFNPSHKLLASLDQLPLRKEVVEFTEDIFYSIDLVKSNLEKLWGNLEFVSIEEVFWPIWQVSLIDNKDVKRELFIDAIVGKELL